jgi:hypothetical protein
MRKRTETQQGSVMERNSMDGDYQMTNLTMEISCIFPGQFQRPAQGKATLSVHVVGKGLLCQLPS